MESYWALMALLWASLSFGAPVLVDEMTASAGRKVFTLSELCLGLEFGAALDGAPKPESRVYTVGEIEQARDEFLVEFLVSEQVRAKGEILVPETEVIKAVKKIENRLGKVYDREVLSVWARQRLLFAKFTSLHGGFEEPAKLRLWLSEFSKQHDVKKFELNMGNVVQMLKHNVQQKHETLAHSKP